MHVSSRLKNRILPTTKTRKGVTLRKVKTRTTPRRRCLSSNFELVPYASIFFAVLSMDIVDWFNFANVKTMSFIFSEHIGLS